MSTVRDLIEGSLRLCNALDPGEAAGTREANDALTTLNDFLDAAGIERLLIPYIASAQYNTIGFQNQYGIGVGADWNGAKPLKIRYANRRDGGIDYPMTVFTFEQYADIVNKSIASMPTGLYYEPQFGVQGRVTLWPVPQTVYAIIIGYDAAFAGVTLDTITDTMSPGYRRFLRYNLALELAPEYGKVKPSVERIAAETKANIKRANMQPFDVSFDGNVPGVRGGAFNIYRG